MIDSDQIEDTQEDYLDPSDPTEEVEAEEPEVEEEESEQDESESEESTEVPAKKSKYVEIKDPEVKARVDQLTREKHEAIRKSQELERRLQALERAPEPPKEVSIPSADPLTEPNEYKRQFEQYDKFIKDKTRYEVEHEQREQQSAKLEQQRLESVLSNYDKNIERLKISPVVMRDAAQVCASYGISKDLGDFLLEDDDGPALVAYLGKHTDELSEIVGMKPTRAIAHLERVIRAKAMAKKVSKAPPPPTKVSGTRKSPASTGATYTIE